MAVGRIGCRAGSASFVRRGVWRLFPALFGPSCSLEDLSVLFRRRPPPARHRGCGDVLCRAVGVPGCWFCLSQTGGRVHCHAQICRPSVTAVCGLIAKADSSFFLLLFVCPMPLPPVLTQSWKCASHSCHPSAVFNLMVGCGESGEDPVRPVIAAGCRGGVVRMARRTVRPLAWIRLRLGQMKGSQTSFSRCLPHPSTANPVSERSDTWYRLRNTTVPDTGH